MMRHPLRIPLLTACLAAMVALPAFAQDAPAATKAAYASVKARLDAGNVRYEIDEDGDYKVVYSYASEGRSQLVFVSGRTEQAGDLRIREVFAPAARIGAGGLDAATANALLRDNYSKILGHWALTDPHLFYVIQVPDSIDAAGLKTVMDLVAQVADDKEIELTQGKDEF